MSSRYSFELQIRKRSERDFAYSTTRCQEREKNKTDHHDESSYAVIGLIQLQKNLRRSRLCFLSALHAIARSGSRDCEHARHKSPASFRLCRIRFQNACLRAANRHHSSYRGVAPSCSGRCETHPAPGPYYASFYPPSLHKPP